LVGGLSVLQQLFKLEGEGHQARNTGNPPRLNRLYLDGLANDSLSQFLA
jgi:hypothetical protein